MGCLQQMWFLNYVVQMCRIIFTTNRLDLISHLKNVLLAVVFKSMFIFSQHNV